MANKKIKRECKGCAEEKTCPEATRPLKKGENVDCYKPKESGLDVFLG